MVWLDREPCSLKENPFQAKFRCQAGAAEQAVPGLVLLLHLHPLHLQAGVHGKKEGFVFIPFLRPMPHNILRWGRPPRGDQDTYFERFSLASFLQKLVYIRETQTRQSSTSTREGFILRGRRESFIWDEIKQSETQETQEFYLMSDKTVGDENAFGSRASPSASSFPAMWNLHSHRSRIQVDRISEQVYIYYT